MCLLETLKNHHQKLSQFKLTSPRDSSLCYPHVTTSSLMSTVLHNKL